MLRPRHASEVPASPLEPTLGLEVSPLRSAVFAVTVPVPQTVVSATSSTMRTRSSVVSPVPGPATQLH